MKNLVLVKKYAQGLVQAVPEESEFRTIESELRAFAELLDSHDELRKALSSPFLNAQKRTGILTEVLAGLGAGKKTTRFLALLLDHKRIGLVHEVVGVLPEAWNDKVGIVTFEVSSVVPLSEGQKLALRRELEEAAKKRVSLVFRLDPALVGGLALKRGHIVYDASVEGQLEKLKEKIQQG